MQGGSLLDRLWQDQHVVRQLLYPADTTPHLNVWPVMLDVVPILVCCILLVEQGAAQMEGGVSGIPVAVTSMLYMSLL